ncbi:hypothetical protein GJ744_010854 [Endocarpon pusillum]|uniref:Uncharacterized protein n=1 Tax=Endocarpon pusillum TaxID=364733 RepID=A0A8H7AHM4_9EURO|nr:hypothetical protein GJ744_010854 [Endocarpon pusillum]
MGCPLDGNNLVGHHPILDHVVRGLWALLLSLEGDKLSEVDAVAVEEFETSAENWSRGLSGFSDWAWHVQEKLAGSKLAGCKLAGCDPSSSTQLL